MCAMCGDAHKNFGLVQSFNKFVRANTPHIEFQTLSVSTLSCEIMRRPMPFKNRVINSLILFIFIVIILNNENNFNKEKFFFN